MLDDLKYIHSRDKHDALGIAEKGWQQLAHQFEIPKINGDFENIVFAGMGGSALAAQISKSWPGLKVPFEICRQYHIPAYVSKKTLFIASSYSGNTEETLAALAEAEEKGAAVVVMANGGQLQQIASSKKYPVILIPDSGQPRFSTLYGLNAIARLLHSVDAAVEQNLEQQITQAADFIRQAVTPWLPTEPASRNPAKELAMELAGKSPVIYAGPLMAGIAYKWKISLNETAKNVAWWNEWPEFNHNEFVGWSSHPIQKPFSVVELISSFEHERVQKRFEVSEKLLSGKWPHPHVVQAQGESLLQQLVWTLAFGDFVSIYLALINNVDPSPVELVERLKKELNG